MVETRRATVAGPRLEQPDRRVPRETRPQPDEPPRVTSTDLLGHRRELVIDHAGEVYRLRCTSKGKLILTK